MVRRVAVVLAVLGAACQSTSSPEVAVSAASASIPVVAAPLAKPGLFPVAHPSEKVSDFTRMLDGRLEVAADGAAVEKIDAEIRAKYEKPLGVMITDMSGMTELTKSRGILGILALIREMQHITVPVLRARGATWVKMEADDLFVTHSHAKDLYGAAHDMLDAIKKHNETTGDTALKVGLGLGWGKVIDLDDDLWGDAVNTASKLGEDTAEPGEILMTEDFHAALAAEGELAPECKPVDAAARKAKFAYYSCR